MLRISDARMSGTSYGACVLHVAPESAIGGPLALVRDGDIIEVNVEQRKLHLEVSDEELAARRAEWKPRETRYRRGYAQLYEKEITRRPRDVISASSITARRFRSLTFIDRTGAFRSIRPRNLGRRIRKKGLLGHAICSTGVTCREGISGGIFPVFTEMKGLVDSRWLRERARVHPWRNLLFLGFDHLCIAVLIASAIAFDLWETFRRMALGRKRPVWIPVALIIGILQHRIGLDGTRGLPLPSPSQRPLETISSPTGSAFSGLRLPCQLPGQTLEHHLHPNDPERDPNFEGGKFERFYAFFRWRSVTSRSATVSGFSGLLRPLQSARSPPRHHPRRRSRGAFAAGWRRNAPIPATRARPPSSRAARRGLHHRARDSAPGRQSRRILRLDDTSRVLCRRVDRLETASLDRLCRAQDRAIDPKWTALFRMTVYSRVLRDDRPRPPLHRLPVFPAFFILWVFPLVYVFPYLMLVREIFQHANAGTGELDNSAS